MYSIKFDILIVEDDISLNRVMCLQLKAIGGVRSATGGREALEMIAQKLPSIIILDLGLPDISGYAVIAQLRLNPETCSLPLIIHSSIDLSVEQRAQLLLGPTKYVCKATADSNKLPELVRELIDG